MKKWEAFLWKHGILSDDRLTGQTPDEVYGLQKKVAFIFSLVVALCMVWYAHELVIELSTWM